MDDTTTGTSTSSEAARPSSMTDAFASVEPTPEPEQPSVSGDAPAIAAPETPVVETGSVSDEVAAQPQGPIPLTVHQKALANARTKEAERVRAEMDTQYAGLRAFEKIAEQDRGSVAEFYDRFRTNPVETALTLLKNLENNPTYAAQVRSHAARTLAGARGQQPAAPDVAPEPDLVTGDGTPVYSAPQQQKRDEWLMRQITAQQTKELQPFQEVLAERKAAKELEARKQADWESAKRTLAPIQRLPDYAEFAPKIAAALKAPENTGKNPDDVVLDTYVQLHTEKLQSLSSSRDATTLTTLQQRAVAAVTNPAAATTATPRRARSMAEAFDQTAGA